MVVESGRTRLNILLFSEHANDVQRRRREDHPKRVRLRSGDVEQFQQNKHMFRMVHGHGSSALSP